MTNTFEHCCEEMSFHLNANEVQIYYNKIKRRYSIPYKPRCGGGVQCIIYCPWCGKQLPSDLNDIYFDIIINDLKLDGPEDQRLPKEFKSDAWWKKRGL